MAWIQMLWCSHWIRRILVIPLLTVFAIGGVAVMVAPYLPRLVLEGYPAAQWPAAGAFAGIQGVERTSDSVIRPDNPVRASLGEMSKGLFGKDGGKALLLHHDGALKLEHYAGGVDRQTRFNSYSLAKSLVGVLVLRAVTRSLIGGLRDPVGKYLPEIGDQAFRAAPLAAFLHMRSGVVFSETGLRASSVSGTKNIEDMRINPFGPMARLHMAGLGDVGSGLRVDPSNTAFSYQNVNTAVLGAVLEKVYGVGLETVLAREIWVPAGAMAADWRRHGKDLPVTPYCCIYARPRDWLQVALFLMSNGDGHFLRPDLWQSYFGRALPAAARQKGAYGLHVYHNVLDRAGEPLQGPFSYMFGSRGQVVYMMPEKKLAIVRFGERIPLLHSTLYGAWRSLRPSSVSIK